MSARHHQLGALQRLRERREDRARAEVEWRRRAEEEPRARALRAKDEMLSEVAKRQAMADSWKGRGKAPTSAADQITGRVLLARKDGEVAHSMQVAAAAADVLVQAVNATAQSAYQLHLARVAKEKSRQGAERQREMAALDKLKGDETELDEETEVQVIARFTRTAGGSRP